MTRILKGLSLSLVAVFALGAISASSAMAATEPVASLTTTGHYNAELKGSVVGADHKFVIGNGLAEVTCAAANTSFTGTLTGPTTSATIVPTYDNCHAKILGTEYPATVTMHSCYYTFTVHAWSGSSGTGDVHIKCPNEGEKIEIHVYQASDTEHKEAARCTYAVEPQTVETGISYANMGSGSTATVTVTANEAPVKVKKLSGTLLQCGAAEANAKYTGNTEVKAESAGAQVGLEVVSGMPAN